MAASKNEKIIKKIIVLGGIILLLIIIALNFSSFKKAFLNIFQREEIIEEIPTSSKKENKEFLKNEGNNKNNPLLIAEIFLGKDDSSSYIKIYNFSHEAINLSEYHIKKISSSFKTSTLVSSKRFKNIFINPFSFITISKENGKIKSEITWPKSYNLQKAYGISLYKKDQKQDEIIWNKNLRNIILKRISWEENNFAYITP